MNQNYGVDVATNLNISKPPLLAFDMAADTFERRE